MNEAVIDVEARIVTDSADAPAPAAPADLAESIVPAIAKADGEIAKINPALEQMRALSAEITAALPSLDLSTKEGEERARALRQRCVKLRTSSEEAYKRWNAPVLEAQRGIRAIVKQVEEGITPAETALDKLIKQREADREAEKQRKIAEEQARIAAIREKISAISAKVPAAVTQSLVDLELTIENLQEMVVDDAAFGEFVDEALLLRNQVITQLMEMLRTRREEAQRAAAAEAEAAEQRRQAQEAQAEMERSRRTAALREKIAEIEKAPLAAMGKTAAQMRIVLERLDQVKPNPVELGELYAQAEHAFATARALINGALIAQEQAEQRERELRALQPTPSPAPQPAEPQQAAAEESPALSMSMFASEEDLLLARAEQHAQQQDDELDQLELPTVDDDTADLIVSSLVKVTGHTEREVLSILLSADMRAQWAARLDEINAGSHE